MGPLLKIVQIELLDLAYQYSPLPIKIQYLFFLTLTQIPFALFQRATTKNDVCCLPLLENLCMLALTGIPVCSQEEHDLAQAPHSLHPIR